MSEDTCINKKDFMGEDRWSIEFVNRAGDAFTVRRGDHVCDFRGRSGYAKDVRLFSFVVATNYGIDIEIPFSDVIHVTHEHGLQED